MPCWGWPGAMKSLLLVIGFQKGDIINKSKFYIMEENYMLLKDKVVIITGATSGFGKETALLFAREGARIVAVAHSSAGEKLLNEIKEM